MPEAPLAYFLSWHTYGTWLHGDERGSVDRDHNRYETPFVDASSNRKQFMQAEQKHPSLSLNQEQREQVFLALRETCDFRSWKLIALHVRTTHVHVVVAAAGPPEPVLTTLKAYATRRLRQNGCAEPERPVWSRHGSTRYLWDQIGVESVVRYVVLEQGALLAPFPWVAEEWHQQLNR